MLRLYLYARVQDALRECAHEHTGTAGASRHSLRNGFTAYAALSLETNSSCLHRRRIDGSHGPVGRLQASASLTPATGARTTRFCRTQLPPPQTSTSQVRPAEGIAKAFKRRSSARSVLAHGRPPCEHPSRLTLPRPPQPAPTSVTMANAPLPGRDGGFVGVIWGSREAEYFFGRDWTGQISLKLQGKIAYWSRAGKRGPSISRSPA